MRKSKVQSPNAHLLENEEWLRSQYFVENKSILNISLMIPCAKLTVIKRFKKFGIESKPKYITYGEIKLNPAFGEKNGNWSGGKHKCPDCNIVLGYRYSKSGKPVKCIKCSGLSRRKPKKEQPDDFIRHSADYRDWRNMVFIRDSYKCQICGINNNNLKAHHLDGFSVAPEKRFDVANGVTLCNDHHIQFHREYGFGGNTKEQFDEFSSIIEVTF